MACKFRDAAREKFKNSGLYYETIKQVHIDELIKFLKIELAKYLVNGGDHALQMDMRLAKLRKKDIYFAKNGFQWARIQVDGSYFERREAITFSTSGFIGFANELSDCNVRPILDAFEKWCDYMKLTCQGEVNKDNT